MGADEKQLAGGCRCEAIRFHVTAKPMFQFVCYCDGCRKINGGLRMCGVSVAEEALNLEGTPTTFRYRGGNAEIESCFCPTCGTPVFGRPLHHEGVVVLRANALDDHSDFQPVKSIYEGQACAWDSVFEPG